MDSELRTLMRNGIAELKKGNHAEAHKSFLKALKIDPQHVPANVYAGASAPNRAKAAAYLKTAKAIKADHPALRKGWELVTKRGWGPEEKPESPRRSWTARSIQPEQKGQPNWWIVAGGTLLLVFFVVAAFFVLVLGTFYYVNVLRPAGQSQLAALPTEMASVTVIVETATRFPSMTPTRTVTQTSPPSTTATKRPTRTVTKTVTLAPTLALKLAYPPVTYFNFNSGFDRYAGQGMQVTGQVVGFGEATLGGEIAFALLLGPPPEEVIGDDLVYTPILVLGIAPDARFNLDTVLTVYGIGADVMEDLIVQGVRWDGAVLLGEGVMEVEEP